MRAVREQTRVAVRRSYYDWSGGQRDLNTGMHREERTATTKSKQEPNRAVRAVTTKKHSNSILIALYSNA
jgi:hypothetical protein